MTRFGQGVYRIIHEQRGWCVAKWNDRYNYWHRVSNFYSFRGWAQNYVRRMGLRVQNYDSLYR